MSRSLRSYLPLICIIALTLVVAALVLVAVPGIHIGAYVPNILDHSH